MKNRQKMPKNKGIRGVNFFYEVFATKVLTPPGREDRTTITEGHGAAHAALTSRCP